MTPSSGRSAHPHTPCCQDFWEIHSFSGFAQRHANSRPGSSGDRTQLREVGAVMGVAGGVGTVESAQQPR